MKLLWPSALLLLVLLPLIITFFLWMQRRKRRYVVRFSSLSLVRQAVPRQSRVRRYLPPALFLLALAILVFGLARPVAVTKVPAGRATVMLVLDVSRSMIQDDIPPSRLAAAQDAALAFIDRQRANNQIGIVAFSSFAQLVQAPSNDSEELTRAIQNLTVGRRTAIGSGILTALDTIAEYNHNVAASSDTNTNTVTPVPKGGHVPDIIVLLTDGVSNAGPDPLEAAQQAADRGVRVYTIGYGTSQGSSGQGSNFFGGGGGGGFGGGSGGFRRGIDEETLKTIAQMTGGNYYAATSAGELQKVFDSLPTHLITRDETMEISVAFAGIGALLLICAVLLAQLWHPLP